MTDLDYIAPATDYGYKPAPLRIALNHPSFPGLNGWTPMLTAEQARRAILALPVGEAAKCKAHPNRLPIGDDFRDPATSQALGVCGFFALNLPGTKRRHAIHREIDALIADAYEVAGFCRRATYYHIAAQLPDTGGIWSYSTGAYGAAVAKADAEVLALSPAILESVAELQAELETIQ